MSGTRKLNILNGYHIKQYTTGLVIARSRNYVFIVYHTPRGGAHFKRYYPLNLIVLQHRNSVGVGTSVGVGRYAHYTQGVCDGQKVVIHRLTS